jgi:hypothetical protein
MSMTRQGLREVWRRFAGSPMYAATVVVLITAAAAGLFAGSYTYAMANPTPRDIPTAVTGVPVDRARHAAFIAGMEHALGASLRLTHYGSYQRAREAVEEQEVFAILRERPVPQLDLSSASGASVAELLAQTAPQVSRAVGGKIVVRDINPLQKGDPRGLAIFYISLASVVVGFVGAAQLAVHAKGISPAALIGCVAAYALLGGFTIAAVTDWALGALRLPFAESWLILALTMFTSGMVFTMFNTLIGRWALLPTWGLMVLLGNPSSGGAVSWPLLPSLLGAIGRWLPPGAAVNAQHTAVYFGGHQHAFPFVVLVAWAAIAVGVFWVRWHT